MITTSRAGVVHAPVLAALHAEAFPKPWEDVQFARLLKLPGMMGLIIGINEQPAGFILAQFVGGDAEIITIGVRPESRRKGLAKRLVGELIKAEPELEKIFIEVNESNSAGLALYRSMGFSCTGVRKNYYRLPDGSRLDALMMTLALGGTA